MRDKTFPPQKVFFDGQIYDAFDQMKKFVRMAKMELIVIDPYFDDSVLPLIAQKRQGVSVLVVKNSRSRTTHAPTDASTLERLTEQAAWLADSQRYVPDG